MRIKYQRTSTSQQHGNRFNEDKDKYDLVLFDQGVSGTLPFKERTESSKLIPLVENSKVAELIVEELRDVGRNMPDTIATLEWLDIHKVSVVIKSMGISSRINGEKNKIWSILSATLSAVYQMERESLLIRTKMGRDAYVRSGKKLGRKQGTTESIKQFLEKPRTKEIISLLEKGKSVRDIAGRLKCSLNTVIKVRKHYLPSKDLQSAIRSLKLMALVNRANKISKQLILFFIPLVAVINRAH